MNKFYPDNDDLIKSATVLNRILKLYIDFVKDPPTKITNKHITAIEELDAKSFVSMFLTKIEDYRSYITHNYENFHINKNKQESFSGSIVEAITSLFEYDKIDKKIEQMAEDNLKGYNLSEWSNHIIDDLFSKQIQNMLKDETKPKEIHPTVSYFAAIDIAFSKFLEKELKKPDSNIYVTEVNEVGKKTDIDINLNFN